MVKNRPAMQETREMRVQSLGWEGPLVKVVAAHSRICAGETPWTRGLQRGQTRSSEWTERAANCSAAQERGGLTLPLPACKGMWVRSEVGKREFCLLSGLLGPQEGDLLSLCSAVSDSFAALWTVTHQPPLSMGFSRQEYWSGLPFPPWGVLSDLGIEPTSLVAPALTGGFFTTEPPG